MGEWEALFGDLVRALITLFLIWFLLTVVCVQSKMTNAYEGSLIRLFRRLEELLRQMAEAAKVMGSEELREKFEVSLSKIRRDIVSFNSLYL